METNRISINMGWRYADTGDIDAPEAIFRPVNLPHDRQIENLQDKDMPGGASQGFFPRAGLGVYRYTFTAPGDWQGKDACVLFDGIQRFSDVYLNGVRIGGRKYGYIPVLCPLENLVYGGENTLTVRVDNTKCTESWTGGGDRWYSGAGIYRNAWFIVNEPCHIVHDGVLVNAVPVLRRVPGGFECEKAKVHIESETCGDVQGAQLGFAVSLNGQQIKTFEKPAEACTVLDFELESAALWSPDSPALYTLTVTLTKPGQECSAHAVRFGVRSAVFYSEEGFILNGSPVKLFGCNFHHDAAPFGAAVPIEIWRRRFEKIKSTGMNAVRCSHNPQCEEFYDLCDEIGLLVIDEYCDKWQHCGMYFDLIDDDERLEEIEIMIRRDRNHPSVILWSVGNEVNGQYSEYWFSTLEKLCAKVRATDPTRGISCALIGFVFGEYDENAPLGKKLAVARRYADIVDVFMGNYMEQLYGKLRESGMRKPIIGSEVFTYFCHDEAGSNTSDLKGNPYQIVHKYPYVCGAFVWAGVDYLGESGGWPCRGWTGCILDSTAEYKLRTWFFASQVKKEPVLKLAVYDESEPWDMSLSSWSFPQMRSHWKYTQNLRMMHIAAMTNCDTVKLYLNNQTPRTGHAGMDADGMIHFWIPYIPGVLHAEGYRNGIKVAEHTLYTDIKPEKLTLTVDKTALPADGRSIAIADVYLTDNHGEPYVLDNLFARVTHEGAGEVAATDNGDALAVRDYSDRTGLPFFNGHLQVCVRSPLAPGKGRLTISAEGYEPVSAEFDFVTPE